jgi:toxin ParE1/3/4
MKRIVTFSEAAREDILNVYLWTFEHFGEAQVNRYEKLIELAVHEISLHPDGPIARVHPLIHPDARVIHLARSGMHASHFLLFRHTEDCHLEIGRLLHESMDLPQHLPDEYRT